jgi:hypothetical protein
MMQT